MQAASNLVPFSSRGEANEGHRAEARAEGHALALVSEFGQSGQSLGKFNPPAICCIVTKSCFPMFRVYSGDN
jgi:hypothetical protein